MQFKKKLNTNNVNNVKESTTVHETVEETIPDDNLLLSDDVSSFVSDDDVGTSFVAPELEMSDFEPIEDDSSGWSSVDTELESKEDYYIDDTEYDSASYNSEIPMPEPPMLDDEEIVEHIVDDGEIVEENDEKKVEKKATEKVAKENKNMANKKMSLRERLQEINEKNDSVLESIDEALVQAAETQNCTSCVVTVDRIVTEGDFVMNYLNANLLDVINVETTGKESKLTISWSWD